MNGNHKTDRFSVNVLPDLLPQQASNSRQFTDQTSSEEVFCCFFFNLKLDFIFNFYLLLKYRQAIGGNSPKIPHQERSFTAFGFNNNVLTKNSPSSSSTSNSNELLKRNPQVNVINIF